MPGRPTGYPPGPNYRAVVHLGTNEDDHTPTLRTNGLEIVTGRTVFHAGQFGMSLVCRKCGFSSGGSNAWSQAVEEWYEASGDGRLACSQCGHEEPVTEWAYNPPWGFGNLGFTFWNWPRLEPSFVAEFSVHLAHRTVLVCGKI